MGGTRLLTPMMTTSYRSSDSSFSAGVGLGASRGSGKARQAWMRLSRFTPTSSWKIGILSQSSAMDDGGWYSAQAVCLGAGEKCVLDAVHDVPLLDADTLILVQISP